LCCQDECQELLTIEDAVKIALENNYAIKIAANELIGKRMYLLVMQVCYLELQHQLLIIIVLTFHKLVLMELLNSLDNAKNNSLNYGVNLDWTVFDGFKMFAKLEQLKELQNRVELKYNYKN
jgi:hypothetical protein